MDWHQHSPLSQVGKESSRPQTTRADDTNNAFGPPHNNPALTYDGRASSFTKRTEVGWHHVPLLPQKDSTPHLSGMGEHPLPRMGIGWHQCPLLHRTTNLLLSGLWIAPSSKTEGYEVAPCAPHASDESLPPSFSDIPEREGVLPSTGRKGGGMAPSPFPAPHDNPPRTWDGSAPSSTDWEWMRNTTSFHRYPRAGGDPPTHEAGRGIDGTITLACPTR